MRLLNDEGETGILPNAVCIIDTHKSDDRQYIQMIVLHSENPCRISQDLCKFSLLTVPTPVWHTCNSAWNILLLEQNID